MRIPSSRRSTAFVAIGALAALGPLVASCTHDEGASPPSITTVRTLTMPPPTTADAARRQSLDEGLVERLGVSGDARACTVAAVAADPRFGSAEPTPSQGPLIAALVAAADRCGAREAVVGHFLDQTAAAADASMRACLDHALSSMPIDQLGALLSGDASSDSLTTQLASSCPNLAPTPSTT
jgi:hypothetical protein